VLKQPLLHNVSDALEHDTPQVPPEHDATSDGSAVLQALPHAPQFALSEP
jgi:hypothetical protein